MKKVVITDRAYESIEAEQRILRGAGFQVLDFQCRTEEEVISCAADCDGLIVQFAPVTRRVVQALTRCRVIVRYAIGLDNIDLEAANERGIMVCNVPDYCLDEVSNHAIAMILACAKKLPIAANSVKEGRWTYTAAKPLYRFSGSRLGLIGFGRIPALVAKKLSLFGLDIVAYDPCINRALAESLGVRAVDLDTLLSTSDFISVHCPLTDESRHMLDRRAFSRMKDGAALINTARGAVLCEDALMEALACGKLSMAALDVLETEPIPVDHPLRSMDHVIVTPHMAWYSEEAIHSLQEKTAEEVARVLTGGTPLNLANHPNL